MADTHYYIDVGLASGDDDGSTPANAWKLMADAGKGMQYASFNAATRNLVWIRRTSVHTMGADINLADDGEVDKPIVFIGWPRPAIPNTTITGADFTNGSNIVDNVAGITVDRESHLGRFITAPDGGQYLITAILYEASVDGMGAGDEFTIGSRLTNTTQTRYGTLWGFTDNTDTTGIVQYVRLTSTAWVENDNITDAAGGSAEIDAGAESAVGFLIDRKYAGSTVTGVSGKFQIEADEDYADRPAAGTTAGWDADAIALPIIDGNSGAFNIIGSSDEYYGFKNTIFKDCKKANGILFMQTKGFFLTGCLFLTDDPSVNNRIIDIRNPLFFIDRCIFVGGGTSQASQDGMYIDKVNLLMRNSAIYGMGNSGIYGTIGGGFDLFNVNFGIESPNLDDDLILSSPFWSRAVDVDMGGINGYVNHSTFQQYNSFGIENFKKVFGSHKSFGRFGTYESAAVSGETPNKKLSDTVLKITPDTPNYEYSEQDWHFKIPLGEINADAGSQTFKFWIYNDTGVTLNDGDATADFYLQADYVSGYGDATAYTMSTATSAEHTIADAADADDWDSLSVTLNPAVESKVRLYLRISIYDTNDIFVDPQVVIT